MKTNNKVVKQAIQEHILNAIDFEDLQYPADYKNDVQSVLRAYKEQSGPLRNMNQFEHFKDFIQGLPSYINLPYYDEDILNVMVNEWGLPQPANKSISDSVDLYYWLIYREFCVLLTKQGLSILA